MERYQPDILFRFMKISGEYVRTLGNTSILNPEKMAEYNHLLTALISLLGMTKSKTLELADAEFEFAWDCVLWARRHRNDPQEPEHDPDRKWISIDYDRGLVYVNDEVYTSDDIDAIGWEADHFHGTKLNPDTIERNKKVVELLDRLKDGQFSGTIVKGEISTRSNAILHQIFVDFTVAYGKEKNDIKTFTEILQNVDEFSVVAILHDEETADNEYTRNNNACINLILENVWKEHKTY